MGWRQWWAAARIFLVLTAGVWVIMPVGRAAAVTRRTSMALSPTSTPTRRPTAAVAASPTATPYTVCSADHTSCLVRYATATPASPTAATGTAPAGSGAGGGDGRCDFWHIDTWGPCIAASTIDNVAGAVADLNTTIGAADIWTNTDPTLTFSNPVVATYWDGVRKIADAFIIFVFLGLAAEMLLHAGAHRTYAGALERFWRLLLVAFLANGSLPVLGAAIRLANLATEGATAIQATHLFAVGVHSGVANQVLLEAILSGPFHNCL